VTESESTAPEGAPPEGSLEDGLKRLEEILGQLEADEVDLERALTLFEEGVRLVRGAERVLSRTTLRVDELLATGETAPLEGDEPG
jgi:exodeoxyribonuclease VII small subunit